mgnify:CR=1 FL=1
MVFTRQYNKTVFGDALLVPRIVDRVFGETIAPQLTGSLKFVFQVM